MGGCTWVTGSGLGWVVNLWVGPPGRPAGSPRAPRDLFLREVREQLCDTVRGLPPLLQAWALLGFALRDSAGGAQGSGGGAHEGRHARGWGQANPWRQRHRATPSGDELPRPSSR